MRELTPELLLEIYRQGIFPMAEDRDDTELFWVEPERRGVLPLESFHVPRRLARTVRANRFEVTADGDFAAVIGACAEPGRARPRTWINDRIVELYTGLHRIGHAHSVECRIEGRLVGGLYGVALGAAFFGESMFSRVRDASKVALVHLVARLKAGGFRLLDTQFLTAHLASFGAVEIPRADYRRLLRTATAAAADFYRWPACVAGPEALQSISDTS
jgi:leucyl/phenylalanyl-tRNA---protein transferase